MADTPGTQTLPASLRIARGPDGTSLVFAGRLDAVGAARLWALTMDAARRLPPRESLVLNLAEVSLCDTAGAALLLAAEAAHGGAVIQAAAPQMRTLIERVRQARVPPVPAPPPPAWTYAQALARGITAAADGLAFVGEVLVAIARAPLRRRLLRISDFLRYADQAGVRALPLVVLMGYLIGLILAFQSAVPMRAFGADLYVANLVSISLLRELGPLLAAVILAGRTGSAYAAEIGTMKVNEEISALVTMGIDPMTMLVLPRLAAAMLVMPSLALLLELVGLLGMLTVMIGFGYTPEQIIVQIKHAATLKDLIGGLFKALCFGAVVGAIGCRAGLRTGLGPRAVGGAATSAVVGGIVATIMLDGLFAVFFFRVGL
jgi:phospholipid/cholesterol/gamma-HCH transport system permease protein